MRISIVGTGYVGLVTGLALAEVGHFVTCIDVNKEKIRKLNIGKAPIYEIGLEELLSRNIKEKRITFTVDYKKAYKEPDVIFIAVGTPEREDGSANLDFIFNASREIARNVEKDTLVVIKSTVPIGTNDRVQDFINENLSSGVKVTVVSNPEFLSQGSAIKDTLNGSRIVIGSNSKEAENILKEVYKDFNQPIITVNRRSAEMIKYASNDFLALKISFINEIANICEIVEADIEEVALGMSYDSRIGNRFLNAGIGYGGSCFPKDTKALHWLANDNGYEIKTIKAAIEVNENQKLKLFRMAKKRFGSLKGKKVAVLGLTFKPETDDLREAPSIINIRRLLDEGANIVVFDPIGSKNLKRYINEEIIICNKVEEALIESEIVFIFTEWKEIKSLDIDLFIEVMKTPIIFDGRNCYSLEEVRRHKVDYYSIGRKEILNYSLEDEVGD
ncbi:nucleotide sugar dehydrogenase [Clostridium tertium]|uniref:UDP-glucose 6-dehydrogenase n=1 Tax=Clostridium tertium TaxID=1559 RepID=A0A6N2ZTD8_9CLOT